jgi:exopolysaccharide biosynthesis polyprenyl glycosylphosphotransferase
MADIHLERPVQPVHRDADVPAVASSDVRGDAPYRRWVKWAVIGDLAAASLGASLARAIRFGIGQHVVTSSGSFHVSYAAFGTAVALAWPVLMAVCGGFELRTLLVGVEEMRRVVRAGVSLFALLGFVFFVTNLDLSRGYVASMVPFIVLFTGAWRYGLRVLTNRMQASGSGHHNVVAVGPAEDLQRLLLQLLARPTAGIDVVAIVADDLEPDTEISGPLSMVRRLPDREAINDLHAEGIPIDLLVRAGRPRPAEVWALARRAHELEAGVAIAPHREDASAHMSLSYVPLGRTPLLVVETPTLQPVARAIKAVFDRLVASAIVLAISPVIAVIALAILLTEGRPIFYSQERVGRNGRHFRCFKFRTMHRDADQRLEELLELNEADGPLFKIRDDPRVTRIGAFLRNHSLDELPQFFNVLGGSMSVVGPRPPLPSEAATYNEREARRLLVKPGITGLWQVEGRSDLPWDEAVYLDLLYVEHWSPLLDLAIIRRTVRAVVRPEGAY